MSLTNTELSKYIVETAGLLQTGTFNELEGAVLGIDFQHLVEWLCEKSKLDVNLVYAESICQFGTQDAFEIIRDSVKNFVAKLNSFNIKPYFVLSGLRNYNQFVRSLGEDSSEGDCKFANRLEISYWVNFFIENNFQYIVAPYSAHTQLLYLQSEGIVDAIFGSTELMMFNKINRIIVNMNHLENTSSHKQTFLFIDKLSVFNSLGISNQLEFTELILILRNYTQPIFFSIPSIKGKSLKDIVEFNKQTCLKTTYLLPKQQSLLEKSLLSLYAAPIYQLNGIVGIYNILDLDCPSSKDEADGDVAISDDEDEHSKLVNISSEPLSLIQPPTDSYEFLGKKLPDEIIFYQSLGMFDDLSKALEAIVYGTYIDSCNYKQDSLKSSLIKKLEKISFDIKQKETKLIVNCMTRYFHKQKIDYKNINSSIIKKFQLETLHQTEIKGLKKISFKLDNEDVKSFKDYFKFDFSTKVFTKLNVGQSFDNEEALLMSVIWRVFAYFFNFADDIDSDDDTDTISLIKSKHLPLIQKISSNLNSFETASQLENFIALIILTHLLDIKEGSDVSFVTYALVHEVKRLLKESFEAVLLWSLLTGDFDRLQFETVKEWQAHLISKLPFQSVSSIDKTEVMENEIKKLLALL